MTVQSNNRVSTFHDNNGLCRVTGLGWNESATDLCPCGEKQTMSHIVNSCLVTKLSQLTRKPWLG